MKPLKEYLNNNETLIWSHQEDKTILENKKIAVYVGSIAITSSFYVIFITIIHQQFLETLGFIIFLLVGDKGNGNGEL